MLILRNFLAREIYCLEIRLEIHSCTPIQISFAHLPCNFEDKYLHIDGVKGVFHGMTAYARDGGLGHYPWSVT